MTINFAWRLVDTVLKLMPPWLVEVGRLLLAGSSSSWFGLWCPAHCSAAIPLLGAVFVAGFGAGVISALLWLVHLFRPNLFPEPSHPANPSTSIVNSRLLAYLHERPRPPAAISEAIVSLRSVADSLERALHESQDGAYSAVISQGSHDWDLVSELASSDQTPAVPHSYSSSYDQIASLITSVLQSQADLCGRLGATAEEPRSRAQRAWEAGIWAKATLDGRIPKPRPTPKLALRPSIYLVIRGPGVVRSVQVGSAAEYFRLVPRFTEDSVSHSFPSVAEARVYCAAIGIDFPGDQ
jgi:hypothetical protein